jgi:hypothetical protein
MHAIRLFRKNRRYFSGKILRFLDRLSEGASLNHSFSLVYLQGGIVVVRLSGGVEAYYVRVFIFLG